VAAAQLPDTRQVRGRLDQIRILLLFVAERRSAMSDLFSGSGKRVQLNLPVGGSVSGCRYPTKGDVESALRLQLI
jgi:hypothetical protein